MRLSLSQRTALGRELMAANTPRFSKHSSHPPTGETPKNQPGSFWGATPPHRAQLTAPRLTRVGLPPVKVCLASTPVQPFQRALDKVVFPVTSNKTGSTVHVKPLLTQSLACRPLAIPCKVGTNSIRPGLAPLLAADSQHHRTPRMIPHPLFRLFQRARWLS